MFGRFNSNLQPTWQRNTYPGAPVPPSVSVNNDPAQGEFVQSEDEAMSVINSIVSIHSSSNEGQQSTHFSSSNNSVVYKVIKDNKYIRIRNNMMEQAIKITYKYYIMIDIHYIIRFKLLEVTHR
jgi:hypothetical protein